MAPEHQVRTLFETSLLRIEDVRCRGSRREKQGEEWTTQHEIALPRFGVFMRHDAAGNTLVDPNHILFFNPGQPYQISHPDPGGDRSTVFVLRAPVLIDLINSFDPSVENRPDHPFPAHHIILDNRLQLLQYWLLHTAAQGGGDPLVADDPLVVEEKVLILLAEILQWSLQHAGREKAKPAQATHSEHADLAEQVKRVLSRRSQERIKLEEIARTVHSSPYHLCRVFKRHTGLSIHIYLKRLRLLQSLEKLAERPNEPLAGIALELGFSSHNHFSAAFREAFDLAPSEFRRSVTCRRVREMSKILKA